MKKETSWEKSSRWYDTHMKNDGGYNHRELILPRLIQLMNLKPSDAVLDLGCGQGILARHLPDKTRYLGLDSSKSLVQMAQQKDPCKEHSYVHHDVTRSIETKLSFSHAVFLLSLQNIAKPLDALIHTAAVLEKGGQLILVLNHPCFRIPKYSSWEFLPDHMGQYRRIDRYQNAFRVEIQMNPSKQERSPTTLSFHRSLSEYSQLLKQAGFYIEELQEICSNKKSYGKAAKSENFARKEIPLFLVISARKNKDLIKISPLLQT